MPSCQTSKLKSLEEEPYTKLTFEKKKRIVKCAEKMSTFPHIQKGTTPAMDLASGIPLAINKVIRHCLKEKLKSSFKLKAMLFCKKNHNTSNFTLKIQIKFKFIYIQTYT